MSERSDHCPSDTGGRAVIRTLGFPVKIYFLQDGLKDHYDIKMLTYLMVARVSQLCPGAVLQKLDRSVTELVVPEICNIITQRELDKTIGHLK